MAAKAFNGWVEGDVAIEIIGKMIANVLARLNRLLDAYKQHGIPDDSNLLNNSEDYKNATKQIRQYQSEIQQIYRGDNTEALLKKVVDEYAPAVRRMHKLTPKIGQEALSSSPIEEPAEKV